MSGTQTMGQRPVRTHLFRRSLWSAWSARVASWDWATIAFLGGGVLLLWAARLGPPALAWPCRLVGLAALAGAALRRPVSSTPQLALRRQRRARRLEIGPEGIRAWVGARRVSIPWEQLEELREHPDDVFEVVGRDASFLFDTALRGWPDALGLLHRFLSPLPLDRQVSTWTLTPAQLEEWLGPLAQRMPARFQRCVSIEEWVQFGLPMAAMGLGASLSALGQPEFWFALGVTALAILVCRGLLKWLRRGQGVEVALEGLTLRWAGEETQVGWAEVVGVAGRSALGTLRLQTRRQVHLLGCVARAPALVRLLKQVVRLNARNPERLTELDVPKGALSRVIQNAPEPSDAALTRMVRREE